MSNNKDANLIWLDLEMTGLDFANDRIIEIATIVTDAQLNTIAEGPVLAIHQSDELLSSMDEWNTKQHNKSGLVERVKQSEITEKQAAQQTLEFLRQYVNPNKSPLCGNSICVDRRFLYRHMPKLERFFHYRNLDVSTVKELVLRWYKDQVPEFDKESKHLALSDIYDSIEELKYYREKVFK
ncbi:MAG: oligoribonuclease [Gammaproteobacteria bacterium]|jgi:oligoribonuclease